MTDLTAELLNHQWPMRIQRTSYFRDRLSNGLVNWQVNIGGRRAFDFIEEAFDLVRAADGSNFWRLKDLANSELSNQLGGSVVLITIDGYAMYSKQGERSAENAYKLSPSGSGSFDARALKGPSKRSLQDLVRHEVRRELCEECGLHEEDVTDIQICGFGRYLYRGGKPEFFCVATTTRLYGTSSVPIRELGWQARRVAGKALHGLDRRDSRALATSLAGTLENEASELERNHNLAPVSGPLIWNLTMAAAYLRRADTERLDRLLTPLLSHTRSELHQN